ncbi:hypothetical protein [Streptomyces malaysiensis]|uniref:hypothetical protein n=1 Tax=Streptomyces malaysiensis TaxID=92644 RepID=UPI0036AD0EE8
MPVSLHKEPRLTDELSEYCRGQYHYSAWEFEEMAADNGWSSIGMIMEPDGQPVSSSTEYRYYGTTHRYAQGASNAEAIERALAEVDERTGAANYAYGPGGYSFVYNASNADVVAVVWGIESALSDYGYLDEERASEIEDEENHPDEFTCYADNDCSCEVATHEHADMFQLGVESGAITPDMDEWSCPYCKDEQPIEAADREVMARIVARMWHDELQAAGQMTVFMFA